MMIFQFIVMTYSLIFPLNSEAGPCSDGSMMPRGPDPIGRTVSNCETVKPWTIMDQKTNKTIQTPKNLQVKICKNYWCPSMQAHPEHP